MKRKLIAGAMGILMMGATVFPVQAKDVSVIYTEPNTYTLTIPDSIDLNSTASPKIEVSEVNLAPGTKIDISITDGIEDNGAVTLTRDDNNATAQTILSVSQTPVKPNTVFATFIADGSVSLDFSEVTAPDGGTAKAGTYKGNLIFHVDAPDTENTNTEGINE